MKLKNKPIFWIAALVAAIGFDQLFWEQSLGINVLIFVILGILGGLIPIWMEKISIPWTSYLLLIPIGFFSAMLFLRAEPATNAANLLLTIACLMLFSISLLNGGWYQYQIWNLLVKAIHFLLNSLAGGILFFTKTSRAGTDTALKNQSTSLEDDLEKNRGDKLKKAAFLRPMLPYLRGALLAIPIVAILAFFLAQADPIFNDRLQNFFSGFRFENLGELVTRVIIILVIAYLLLSAYYFALTESKDLQKAQEEKNLVKPFLGFIEANMVLGGVNLLFLLFVILQFSYLFSGGKNISEAGYTYAEYARRGFFELILVAVLSLLLFYSLSMITKRENKSQRWVFSGLGLTLVALVGMILISAYKRLGLYEMAYGFTRLRTLAHIFMIWIGLLLIAIAFLEIRQKMSRLAFVLICFLFGFGLSINILNIDRFIVNQNVNRAIRDDDDQAEFNLDAGYLFSLSDDAVPPLVDFFTSDSTPEKLKNEIGSVLACKSAAMDDPPEKTWVSYHDAHHKAQALLENLSEDLHSYPVSYDMYTWFVEVNGEVRSCDGYQEAPYD